MSDTPWIQAAPAGADGPAILLHIKAVPGAKRDEVAGVIGDRLKVRVSAPPEDGKANRAICGLIASALGVKAKHVSVESGNASPQKTLRIEGIGAENAAERLGLR